MRARLPSHPGDAHGVERAEQAAAADGVQHVEQDDHHLPASRSRAARRRAGQAAPAGFKLARRWESCCWILLSLARTLTPPTGLVGSVQQRISTVVTFLPMPGDLPAGDSLPSKAAAARLRGKIGKRGGAVQSSAARGPMGLHGSELFRTGLSCFEQCFAHRPMKARRF